MYNQSLYYSEKQSKKDKKTFGREFSDVMMGCELDILIDFAYEKNRGKLNFDEIMEELREEYLY